MSLAPKQKQLLHRDDIELQAYNKGYSSRRVIETHVEVSENEDCCENPSHSQLYSGRQFFPFCYLSLSFTRYN